MGSLKSVDEGVRQGSISAYLGKTSSGIFSKLCESPSRNGYRMADLEPLFDKYLSFVYQQIANPYDFGVFHQRITAPFNYYNFGLDLFRPLINFPTSKVRGLEYVDLMEAALARGENVVLLSNHQVEPDPQAINLLLQKTHPQFCSVTSISVCRPSRRKLIPADSPFQQGEVNLDAFFKKLY